jgi:general secretion pathway protein M
MIKTFWGKLDEKQRMLAVAAVSLVVLIMILQLAFIPFWKAKTKLTKSLKANQKKLAEISLLDAEFAAQEGAMAKIKNAMSARGADFTLFAHLERKAAQANVRGRIKQMNSSKGFKSSSLEESLIDMKLEKITIKQLNDFLYYIESPADLVRIKKITVSKMKESPEYLNAQLQISSFQTLNQQQGGNKVK